MFNRVIRFSIILFVALGLIACEGLLDVENPNTLEEGQLDDPTAAEPMVNGLQANVTEALTSMYSPYSTFTDELTWVGSRDAWLNLSWGFMNSGNEFIDTRFLDVGEAEWVAREFIGRLEEFQEEGELDDEALLAKAYLHGAIIKTTVGDMFSNWAFSDRTEAGEPVGEENMEVLYDQALEWVDEGLQLDAAELEPELTALKARILYSRSLWDKTRPAGSVETENPLVDDEDAAEAASVAQDALDLMGDDFIFDLVVSAEADFTSDIAFQVNQRNELIPDTTVYVNTETDDGLVVDEVIFEDPVDNVVHPFLERIINTRYPGVGNELSDVTIVSAREMHLIIAENALANGDVGPGSAFRTHINNLRDLDDELSSYEGPSEEGVERLELLKNSRQANLYLQGRRLADMYRFEEISPGPEQGWESSSDAVQNPGTFIPLPATELRANPNL